MELTKKELAIIKTALVTELAEMESTRRDVDEVYNLLLKIRESIATPTLYHAAPTTTTGYTCIECGNKVTQAEAENNGGICTDPACAGSLD